MNICTSHGDTVWSAVLLRCSGYRRTTESLNASRAYPTAVECAFEALTSWAFLRGSGPRRSSFIPPFIPSFIPSFTPSCLPSCSPFCSKDRHERLVAQGTPSCCFRLASGFRPGTLRDQGSTGAAGESASLPSLQGHQGFGPTRFAVKEWRVQCRRLHRTIRRTFAQPLGAQLTSLFLSNSVTTSPNTWTPRSPRFRRR